MRKRRRMDEIMRGGMEESWVDIKPTPWAFFLYITEFGPVCLEHLLGQVRISEDVRLAPVEGPE